MSDLDSFLKKKKKGRKKMSRIRRMSNIRHYRISHRRKYAITKRTPIVNEESKYDALYNTLSLNYKGSFQLISESGEANNYETLVYLFLEANTWHNLTKSAILTENPNLRSSRCKAKGMSWLKKLSTVVLERENIAESIPRRER